MFSVGDSRELKTWSNVPFLFARALETKGIMVNRVNLEDNRFLDKIYKYSIYAFLKLSYPNSSHAYFRSGLNHLLTERKINKATRRHTNSDIFLFLTYSF